MAIKRSIEHIIEPAHLMYHLVKGHPKFSGTDLEALVLGTLCSFAVSTGKIIISETNRQQIEEQLQLSPQQLSNNITRLVKRGYLADAGRGKYQLHQAMMGVIGSKLKKTFTVKFKADEPALTAQSTSVDIRDVEANVTE